GDVEAALTEAARVVRPGGRVIASVTTESLPTLDVGLILMELHRRLGRPDVGPDAAEAVIPAAARAGLRLAARIGYRPSTVHLSPAAAADRIAARSWSWMWQVDEQAWAEASGAAVG